MLDIIFALLLIVAIIMMMLSFVAEESGHLYWSIVSIFLAIGIWLILAVGGLEIETGYQIFNASSGSIETGYQTYFHIPELAYLYAGFGIVCMIYMVTLVLEPMGMWFKSITRWK